MANADVIPKQIKERTVAKIAAGVQYSGFTRPTLAVSATTVIRLIATSAVACRALSHYRKNFVGPAASYFPPALHFMMILSIRLMFRDSLRSWNKQIDTVGIRR